MGLVLDAWSTGLLGETGERLSGKWAEDAGGPLEKIIFMCKIVLHIYSYLELKCYKFCLFLLIFN